MQNEINGDINPLVMAWMSQTVVGHLQTVRDSIALTPADVALTPADIAPYVIKRSAQPRVMDSSSQRSSENEEAFESAEEGK